MASSVVSADGALSDADLVELLSAFFCVDLYRICVYVCDWKGRPRQACWEYCDDSFLRHNVPHAFGYCRDRLSELAGRFGTAQEGDIWHILDRGHRLER